MMHALYLLASVVAITAFLLLGFAATGVMWFKNVFRAWDCLGAALFGGDGRHTISAYCGRAQRDNGPGALQDLAVVIDFIFGKGHCVEAANRENP